MEDSTSTIILIVSAICVVLVSVLIVVAIALVLSNQSRRKKNVNAIKMAGMRGEATVLDYQVTPTDSESDDIAWVRLEMRVPGLTPYILEKRGPLRYAGLLKEGLLVAVWVDKNDPQNSDKAVIEIQSARR